MTRTPCFRLSPKEICSISRRNFASHPPPSSSSHLSLDPNTENAMEWMQQGNAKWEAGDLEGAIDCYQKSAWSKPNADAYYNIGNCWCLLGKFEKGAEAWQRSIALDASRPDVHVNLANVFAIHLKNPQKAVEHYKKAIALDKEDGEIRYNYAAVLDHLGNLEEAANEYEMAAQLGVARAQENLRNVKAKIKEKELAASIKKE